MQTNHYVQYQQVSVQTASPEKLLIMLYDGAIKFLNQAKEAMANNDIKETNRLLGRTHDIIAELIDTLKMDYEIAHNLYSIYDYINRRLVEANARRDSTIIDGVIKQLSELRESWMEAAIKLKAPAKVVGGVNVEG
ncbi:MAG: flagellar export chaperone FliS [Thermincolia bacterium]